MPSAKSSSFRGGGGILRKKDGTILNIDFTPVNPLFDGKPAPKLAPGQKRSDFVWLYAVLTIQEDGREELTQQPLKVGSVDDFEVVLDGRGVSGTMQFGKGSEFGIFAESLSHPKDEGAGFDESNFPEDLEGLVADYTAIIGARVQFDWVKDESKWGLANPRKGKDKAGKELKGKDGKPILYDRENLIVRSYYGQVDVADVPAPVAKQGVVKTAPKKVAKPAVASVDIPALAASKVVAVLSSAKGNALTINKLSVKLLTEMSNEPDTREDVRAWSLKGDNLATIPGVLYDKTTQVVSLEEAA